MPIIPGTSGNDTITGTAIEDTITAGAGADLIDGGAGVDVIYGDSGNSLSAGGEGVPGDTLGDGPGSTGGGYARLVGQPEYNTFDFSSDAFFLGNDIPYLDVVNDDPFEGTTFSQDGSGADRAFSMDEIAFENGSQSFVGVISIEESDSYGSDATMESSLTGPQEIVKIADVTVHFTMNDGTVFNNIRMYTVQDEDANTFMVPSDGPTPGGFNAFRNMLASNDSGIAGFEMHTVSGDNDGAIIVGGNWADGQILEREEGDGGDDTITGGEGADQMFGEGGDDTFVVSSAADGAGDAISGGFGPDETTDNDVLDLTGAGPVTINATADANDAGAQSGTVTFADGSTLTFEGIETIIQDPDNTAPDVTGPAAVDVAEDDTDTIATYATTDPDGDPVALTLTGDDAALFEIDPATGELSPINPLDFENPTDANGDGVYDVTVVATDTGGLTDEQPVAVTVTDVPEPNAIVDGEDTGEVMRVGYDDSNAPTDGGGDLITDEADVIDGNGGDDTISSGGGDDTVDGGADDDLLDGGAGDDEITGGTGTDTLIGGAGADTLDGGGDDDDITVGAGDTALGGSGDDEFYVNPSLTGDAPITVVGGELDESLSDPTNGGDGDTLDLRGLGPVTVDYDETDPTFDPVTGVSESGTVTYTNDAGEPVTIDFSEIEDVLTDPQADGIVDGAGEGELMNPGYNDPQGDQIDGDDGVDDVIEGNGGDDTINAGLGDDDVSGGGDDDLIDGEEGNDTLAGNEGNDTLDGGDGDDTLLGGDEADTLTGGEGDDVLDGEDGDDDIAVGGSDVADGGLGDDVFTVDPTDTTPDVDVTIDGGSDGTTGDPAGPENGDEGDILDLSDQLGDLEVVLEPNPESGTVDGLDVDETPDLTFDEIEQIETGLGDDLIDGTDAVGPVDAAGNEGEDTLLGGIGDDTLDGGDEDDLLDGGDGDDVLDGGDGTDTLAGGEGADTLSGGLDDDDLFIGAGDTALGGAGDDEFYVDPSLTGDAPITVVGGEVSEDLTDPENGGDGDTLDLLGLGPVTVDYDETDPTYDPETGVSESGTVTYTNDAGDPVTIDFSEIEDVLTDGPADVTPVANPDTAGTDEDAPVVIDVLANDTDPDTPVEDLEVTSATAPNGTVVITSEGTLEYTPDPDFNGEDVITYTVTDPDGNTATGTATVEVAPVNDDPIAEDDTGTTVEETPVILDVLANDSDVETPNEDLEVTDAEALNGTVSINDDGTVEYTPDAGFVGTDTITYTVTDEDGGTDTAEVTVTVTEAPTSAPVANPDTAEVEEEGVVTIDVLANDTDPDTPAEDLEVADAEAENGIVDINPDGTISYEPDAGFTGDDTITYTVTDPDGNTATSSVTVTVTPDAGDDAPDAVDDAYDFDIDGYGGGNILLGRSDTGLLGNDTDPTDDPLRVIEVDGNTSLRGWYAGDNGGEFRVSSSGAVRFRDEDGDFSEVPDGEVVQTSISYTISDGNGGTDTATVTLNVTGAADVATAAPDAVDDTANATAGSVAVIDVLANDTDADTPAEDLEVVDAEALNGIVDINPDGTISYEPDEGFTGTDTISYTITDPEGNTDTAVVTVTVAQGEVTPVANPDTVGTDEDAPVIIDVLANDTDPDTPVEDLEITAATAPNGTVVITPEGTLEYTPDPDFNGEDEITYIITDPDGNTATGTATVEVAPVNDDPLAEDDTGTTVEETPVILDVLANDSDVETPNEDLEVTDAEALNGIVDINDDGTITYEPDAGFVGTDTITYTVTDEDGGTDTAEVTVTVTEAIDGTPIANPDDADVDEDDTITIDVLANDTDPDGAPEDLEVTEATAPNGTVVINDDGTLAYTPDPDFTGDDTITYTVRDPDGNTAQGTASIAVAPVNDAPVAADDSATTDEDTSVTIDVLANDTDVDNTPEELDVTEAQALNGSVTINDDGTLEYTPNTGFAGTDEITYTVADLDGATSTAMVSVTVNEAVEEAPIANPDLAIVDEDETVNVDVLANDSDPDAPDEELEVISAIAPNGDVVINSDGTLDYTPNPDVNGEDTITYTIRDADGNTATSSVVVTIGAVNDLPVATDDSATTDEDTSVTIDVLANDSDVEDGTEELDVTSATAANGSVTINDDGTLEYTPDTGFTGVDTIDYTITDTAGGTASAEVSVTVEEDDVIGGPDGVVDGEDTGEDMGDGYDDGNAPTDGGGDLITGGDDVIDGNGGDDTIDGGSGNDEIDGGSGDDVIRGGDGNDTIEGSEGNDDILGGAGDDTYQGDDVGHVVVYVDDNGNGDVTKYPSQEIDAVNSIEHFSGAEIEGEDDKISFTDAVGQNSIETDIQGLDDNATGYFFPSDGQFINFGPENDYMLSDIFSGTSPDGELPAVGPAGEYFVNGGTEEGQIGNVSFDNFEQIFFTIEEEAPEEEDIMAMLSNGETLDETMPTDEILDEDEEFDAFL